MRLTALAAAMLIALAACGGGQTSPSQPNNSASDSGTNSGSNTGGDSGNGDSGSGGDGDNNGGGGDNGGNNGGDAPAAGGNGTAADTGPTTAPQQLAVQESPFQLCFNTDVCTSEAPALPLPSAYAYAEGPRPVVNPQTAAAFPAFGWVVGSTENEVIPTFIWQGNRLSGRDTGTLYQVTTVAATRNFADRIEIDLKTNYAADPTPARLTIRQHASGAISSHLEPPPAMRTEGIALTIFSFDSPTSEGLFGMGARKDFFNQRGKLRNVWTEQQNTGLGSLNDLSFTGAGAPSTPAGTVLSTGLTQQDVDDAALAEERTTFPNGAQAAYWVEAFLVGSRGWAAWTSQMHFQRLDLAATLPDKIRWQVVDSDEVTLFFADGGIEEASRAYTGY